MYIPTYSQRPPAVPVALDLKLGQRPVTVIVDLQPQSFHLREGEYLIQEILFKGAVSVVGQIVEGVILLGVGGILLSERGRDRPICRTVICLQSQNCRLNVRLHFQFALVIQDDLLYLRLFGAVGIRSRCLNHRREILNIQQAGRLGMRSSFVSKERLSQNAFRIFASTAARSYLELKQRPAPR